MEMGWWFHPKEKTPKYSAEMQTIGGVRQPALQIPPNTVTQHQGMTVLKAPAILHNFQPHMHYRGQGADARGHLSRWPAGGHQPGQPLHQHLAHQLHLRSRLCTGLPQGNRPHRDVDSRQYGRQQEQSGSAAVGDLGRPDRGRDGALERAGHLHHGRGLPADRRGTPEKNLDTGLTSVSGSCRSPLSRRSGCVRGRHSRMRCRIMKNQAIGRPEARSGRG